MSAKDVKDASGGGKKMNGHDPVPSAALKGTPLYQTPLDEEWFNGLDYWKQWDVKQKISVLEGMGAFLPFMLIHLAWHVFLLTAFFLLNHYVCGASELEFMSKEWFNLSLKNLTIWHYQLTCIGITGMCSGSFLLLEIGQTFPFFSRGSQYKFIPGTLKEPMSPFKSILWTERNYLDILLVFVQWAVNIMMLVNPEPSFELAAAYVGFTAWKMISNVPEFLCEDGYIYFPLNVFLAWKIMYGAAGTNAACQMYMLTMYLLCGVGKFGPWFNTVFAQEWTSPPYFSGSKFWRNLMYVDVDNEDYTVTTFASVFGQVAAATEAFAGFAIFLSPDMYKLDLGFSVMGVPIYMDGPLFGVLMLVAMHAYIVGHLPCFDVAGINYVPAMAWPIISLVNSWGFDWADYEAMPLPLFLFAVSLFATALIGQFYPQTWGYSFCYRFWAGNWPMGFWLIRDETAMKKLMDNVVNGGRIGTEMAGPGVFEKLGMPPRIAEHAARHLNSAGFPAVFWPAQLCMRNQPALQKYALDHMGLDKRSDARSIVAGFSMQVHTYGLGFNDLLRSEPLVDILQKKCQFESGECVYVLSHSFPAFASLTGAVTNWTIRDLHDGEIASGCTTVKESLSFKKPSDSKRLYDKMRARAKAGVARTKSLKISRADVPAADVFTQKNLKSE